MFEKARLTGSNPPGGVVLAQLQSGSWHFEVSQEYPAACALLVGPVTLPSCPQTTLAHSDHAKRAIAIINIVCDQQPRGVVES